MVDGVGGAAAGVASGAKRGWRPRRGRLAGPAKEYGEFLTARDDVIFFFLKRKGSSFFFFFGAFWADMYPVSVFALALCR
jgi:hypothetical protein